MIEMLKKLFVNWTIVMFVEHDEFVLSGLAQVAVAVLLPTNVINVANVDILLVIALDQDVGVVVVVEEVAALLEDPPDLLVDRLEVLADDLEALLVVMLVHLLVDQEVLLVDPEVLHDDPEVLHDDLEVLLVDPEVLLDDHLDHPHLIVVEDVNEVDHPLKVQDDLLLLIDLDLQLLLALHLQLPIVLQIMKINVKRWKMLSESTVSE